MHSGGPTISTVSVRTAPYSRDTWLDERRVSTPMTPYPRFARRRASWRGPGSDLVWVMIETEDPAVFGIGQARGGEVVATAIRDHLMGLLAGQDVQEVVRLSQECSRAMHPYAAGGLQAMATSAVELGLWDATARAAGVPLFRLLGGSPGPLPYYLTVPTAEVEIPEGLLAGAALVKASMPYGPADGLARMADNLSVLEALRAVVPAEIPLAVDCFMSWDVPYAVEFARRAERLGLWWIEEPLAPEDLAGHRALTAALPAVRMAGGEHVFGLRAGAELIESGAVAVVQPDVTWCGGLGAARAIADLASARGLTFAPHNAAAHPWALHLLAACAPPVLAEVLLGADTAPAAPAPSADPGAGITPGQAGF